MRLCTLVLAALVGLAGSQAHAAHGYALWDDLKYPAGFSAFDYVNPDAPKGGELRLVSNLRYSTFDKYNPFTLKGSPPAYLADLMFETLLYAPMDETASAYLLLAAACRFAVAEGFQADGCSAKYRRLAGVAAG